MEPNLASQSSPQISQSTIKIVIAILFAFTLGLAVMYLWQNPQFLNSLPFVPQPKACTLEAKLCPDGTAVGRIPPNCEFVVCPSNNKESCQKLGGIWEVTDSQDNHYICNLPTSDAGKECNDCSQCESYCQASGETKTGSQTIGRCYEWKETVKFTN